MTTPQTKEMARLIDEVAELTRDLSAAQEALEAAEAHEMETHRTLGAILGTDDSLEQVAKRLLERAQRAEALAESYRKDAERYRWLKAENSSMESWRASVRIALDAYTEETGHQGDELDAAIDAAREGK